MNTVCGMPVTPYTLATLPSLSSTWGHVARCCLRSRERRRECRVWLLPARRQRRIRTRRGEGGTLFGMAENTMPRSSARALLRGRRKGRGWRPPQASKARSWVRSVGEVQRYGSLLMAMPGPPRDQNGWPYQVVTLLKPGGAIGGLYLDGDGHPLALSSTHDGPVFDVDAARRVPEEVERAALSWWRRHGVGD
jgi:hypothetical protein